MHIHAQIYSRLAFASQHGLKKHPNSLYWRAGAQQLMVAFIILWAEDNCIVCTTRASKGAGLIILRVTVRSRTPILKKFRVSRRSTAPGITTVIIGLEYGAWVIAAAGSSELVRTLSDDVGVACYTTATAIGCRVEFRGNIKSIDQGYVEEVEVVKLLKSEFS